MGNYNLHNAKRAKQDEFYTQLEDIEKELRHYDFKGKNVYCNCDNPYMSNFYKYFKLNFNYLGIKELISTGYNFDGQGYYGHYDGVTETIKNLEGNGDFRSEECIEFLKEADVVVTNPPFSLFREYVAQLMEHGKKFLIIGSMNAITYKDCFTHIKNNKLWLGMNWIKDFVQPNGEIKKFGNICWYTNLEHNRRNTELDLYKKYSADEYLKYDNFDAIEVSKVAKIPMDYDGVMGVPITFLDKYCPTQFEIVGIMNGAKGETFTNGNDSRAKFYLNGKGVYARLLIKILK